MNPFHFRSNTKSNIFPPYVSLFFFFFLFCSLRYCYIYECNVDVCLCVYAYLNGNETPFLFSRNLINSSLHNENVAFVRDHSMLLTSIEWTKAIQLLNAQSCTGKNIIIKQKVEINAMCAHFSHSFFCLQFIFSLYFFQSPDSKSMPAMLAIQPNTKIEKKVKIIYGSFIFISNEQ